jgi:DNA-binding NarL/FixJ family response regulator
MLKAPLAQREEHETAGKEQKKYSGLVHSDAHLERIGDAIEQSVSETLSGQIMAMLQGSAFSRLQSTPFASEQTWARSDAPPALPAPHRKGAGADASAKVSEQLDIPEDAELNDVIARAGLSKRQVDVLRLLGKGMTNREIAEALFRSPHTIKLHVSAILERLHLKSRTQAALLASKL